MKRLIINADDFGTHPGAVQVFYDRAFCYSLRRYQGLILDLMQERNGADTRFRPI
jgi:hypothetical protein